MVVLYIYIKILLKKLILISIKKENGEVVATTTPDLKTQS